MWNEPIVLCMDASMLGLRTLMWAALYVTQNIIKANTCGSVYMKYLFRVEFCNDMHR